MRAVIVREHGGPEVLTLVQQPAPEPAKGEVLVDVAAAGVNFIDIYQRSGVYPTELPYVVGSEAAGTVAALGDGVRALSVGDRVCWAMVAGTGAAEQVVVPAEMAVRVPEGVALDQAAAVMLQGMTAHYLVESTYRARSGQSALVHAAAGGVGLLLCQMLHAKGVRVIGTTSTADKAALARDAGADEVVRYRDTDLDLVTEVRRLTDGAGVHVVYDGVGRDTFQAGLQLLRPRGTMVLFGAASGPVPAVDPQDLNAHGSLFLTRPSLAHHLLDRAELEWRAGEVLAAVAEATLQVRIGGRYPLADLAVAHEDLATGRTTGKCLVLT